MLVPSGARDEGIGRRAPETRHCHPAGEFTVHGEQVPSGQRLATRPEAEPKCDLRKEVRVYAALPKRFDRFGLTIHPTKSRLIEFRRSFGKDGKGTGTFDFLGFTHYWGKTRGGGWTIKRKTRRARQMRAHKAIWTWCRDHRHWSVPEQHRLVSAKLRGYKAYYGIRGNYKALGVVFEYVEKAWKHCLGRRTRNGYIQWKVFDEKYRRDFPLPRPRIVHSC